MAKEPDFYDDDLIDYRYYLDLFRNVLLKHYKLIVTSCLVSIIAAVLYVQSQPPSYVSTATLHLAANNNSMFSFEQWMWSDDEKFQDTQIGILQSKKLLRRVVEKIELHKEKRLTPQTFDAGIINSVSSWLTSLSEEPVPVTKAEEDEIRTTAAELSSLMTISKPPNRDYSNLLNVGVTMADPQIAALTANTIVEEYIAMVFENEIENAQKNQQFLSERLTVLREELRIAEQTLQVYREDQNIVTRSSGPNEVDEELSSLSTRFFDARENRLRQENLNQQLQKLGANGKGWEKLTAISNHSRVTQVQSNLLNLERRKGELSKRYGRRHNTMIALESEIASARQQVNTEVRDIIEGIRNEYKLAQRLERAAEENLNQVRDRKQLRGRNEFELNDLQQDVDAKRQVYAIFLERLNQDGASGPSRNHNLWIADPAVVPKAGHRTSLTKAGLVAFILSFGAAMTLGLFFELTNNTIKTGDDVEKKLKVPLLGFLPLIAGNVEEPGLPLREYITNPESRFSEALRTIRTLITLSSLNSPGVNKLLITSSQSHEGKTSVSLSLAAALGKTSKVLLIDGDLRKPSLERILDQSNHKFFGLADVIAGEATIDEAVQHKESEQFDVMYAGSRTIKPLELLSSHQFRQLIDDLSTRYETIVIDSPPCISVSDAYVISTLVDSIVFVTKSNEVPVPTIRSCINRFSDIDASIAGVLINQIDLDAVHNYGKYQDHYDYHGYGEKISDETDIAKR